MNRLPAGLVAGAAGTTALNLITYLDMTLRGRPASELPTLAAHALAGKLGVPLGAGEAGDNRASAAGALLGMTSGLGVGAGYAALSQSRARPLLASAGLAAAAMAASDGPMVALGLTDPRTWKPADWISDLLPHLAYGLAVAVTFRALTARRSRR